MINNLNNKFHKLKLLNFFIIPYYNNKIIKQKYYKQMDIFAKNNMVGEIF